MKDERRKQMFKVQKCQETSVIDIATWELDLKQPRK
jgi:hypothetical protein